MKIRNMITYAALTAVCLLLVIPTLIYMFPLLAGADGSYTVMSGSMSPALNPGDMVIVKETDPSAIQAGDILTIRSEEFIFTHRVVERLEGETTLFRMKGDANEEPDPNLVKASQIIGKVILIFPFSHLYTPYGFTSALLVPATLIIGKQMHTIYQLTKRRNKRETMRWRRSRGFPTLDTSTVLLALILTVGTTRIMAPHLYGGSSSYFSDIERGWDLFSAGIWEVTATVDIDPDTLNLESQGEWITIYASIDTEYDENDIVVSTVKLDPEIYAVWGEVQEDGRLMVKFERASVIDLISEGYGDGDEVTITVSGEFKDGVRFKGSDTIKIIG